MKARTQRNRTSLFWQRVLSGLFVVCDFRHFRIDEIALNEGSEYARASELTVIVTLIVSEDLEGAQIHFRIRKNNSTVNFLELDYNNRPTEALVHSDISNLETRTTSIKNELARVFRIFSV